MPDWSFLVAAGTVMIILGFLLVAFGMMRSAQENACPENRSIRETGEKKVNGGGVILIGPIPVVFGTDKRYALIAMLLAIVIMLLAVILLK